VDDTSGCHSTYTDSVKISVGVAIEDVIASKFSLSAYPNPFSDNATLSFTLDKANDVSVIVSDVLGREITNHNYGKLGLGKHEITLDAGNFSGSSATYVIKIQIGDDLMHKTLIKQK